MAKEFSMGPDPISTSQSCILRVCVKKIRVAWILSAFLCLLPSVAYAHDLSGYVFFPIGVVFLQVVYGIYMLLLKKNEITNHYFVVSGLYIIILGLLWLGVLLGFRAAVNYFQSVSSFSAFYIFMIGYWIIFPLGAAPLVAWGLYRRFRNPSGTLEPPRDEAH
jgi:hypothetical protein